MPLCLRVVAESFCSRFPGRSRIGRAGVSYTPDQEYQLFELLLYVMSFITVILIFLYIASERPGEQKKSKEEEEE